MVPGAGKRGRWKQVETERLRGMKRRRAGERKTQSQRRTGRGGRQRGAARAGGVRTGREAHAGSTGPVPVLAVTCAAPSLAYCSP